MVASINSRGKGKKTTSEETKGDFETYEEGLSRQDSRPFSSEGSKVGRLKSHINEKGNLEPANKNGDATVQYHVRGSEPKKSDNAYTSFTKGKSLGSKEYGNQVIDVNIKKLSLDIESGKVKNVEILFPEQVQEILKLKVDQAKFRYDAHQSDKNKIRLENTQRDLNNSTRDNEVLIKDEIPKRVY